MATLRDVLIDFDPLATTLPSKSSPKEPLFPPAADRTVWVKSPEPSSLKRHRLTPVESPSDPLECSTSGIETRRPTGPKAVEADRRTRVRQEALLDHLSRAPYADGSRSRTPLVDLEPGLPASVKPLAPSWSAIGQQALDASVSLWPDSLHLDGSHRNYAGHASMLLPSSPPTAQPIDAAYDSDADQTLKTLQINGTMTGMRLVMDPMLGEAIRRHLPRRLRLSATWDLIYSLDRDGTSITTLYDYVRRHFAAGASGGCILVIQDMEGQRFGAYVNEALRPAKEYYGTGECFLWRSVPPISSSPSGRLVDVFHWTGHNDYMVLTDLELLSVGGGDGKFGLCVDAAMEKGVSARCPAFNNDVLCSSAERSALGREEGHFEVFGLEVFSCG